MTNSCEVRSARQFHLPHIDPQTPVRLVVMTDGEVEAKAFVATVHATNARGAEQPIEGIGWSVRLESPFFYLPENSGELIGFYPAPTFTIDSSTECEITVSMYTWPEAEATDAAPVRAIYLDTTLDMTGASIEEARNLVRLHEKQVRCDAESRDAKTTKQQHTDQAADETVTAADAVDDIAAPQSVSAETPEG